MKNFFLTLIVASLMLSTSLMAQVQETVTPTTDKFSLGLGMGFDYGGFGGNLLFYPQQNIGLFAGVGYAIAGVGYNAGIKARLVSKSGKVNPYLMAMYGYNAAIHVTNAEQYDKLFYNVSFALGFDYKRRSELNNGYWSLALTIPVRSKEVQDYMDDLKNNHRVQFKNSLPPVGISIGYHIVFM